jgi:hypothetical protein
MIIEITNGKVLLKDSLNWGEVEEIQDSLNDVKFNATGSSEGFSMKQMREMQYKILDKAVTEIEQSGEKIVYSKEWLRSLSIDDATAILEKASELLSGKKK